MQIDAISVCFPAKCISVDETVDMIRFHSKTSFQGDLDATLGYIRRLLQRSGARTRYWLAEDESPIDLLANCVNETLARANCSARSVDMLIYTGIGRGYIEPAQACILAKKMGMLHTQCLDIVDACMSWSRALQLAWHYLHSRIHERILIVNAEFLNIPGGALYPVNYAIENSRQIRWLLPTYTLGEAATATLLSLGDNKWQWQFRSLNDKAHLCTIPSQGYRRYTSLRKNVVSDQVMAEKDQTGRLSSFGQELHEIAGPELKQVLHALDVELDKINTIFPHASSSTAWNHFADIAGISGKLYHIYPEYGNLISASLPAAMELAFREKRISRGEQLINWVGSAGMSFSAYSYVF